MSKLTPEQEEVKRALAAHGIPYHGPSDPEDPPPPPADETPAPAPKKSK